MKIEIVAGNGVREEQYFTQKQLIGGRAPDNELVLADTAISRQHLRFAQQGDTITVTDLGSENGTYLEQTRLPANIACVWTPGTELRVGPYRLRLLSATVTATTTATSTPTTDGVRVLELPTRVSVQRWVRLPRLNWQVAGRRLSRFPALRSLRYPLRLPLPLRWRSLLQRSSLGRYLSGRALSVVLIVYVSGTLLYQRWPLLLVSKRKLLPTPTSVPRMTPEDQAHRSVPTFTPTALEDGLAEQERNTKETTNVQEQPAQGELGANPAIRLTATLVPTPTPKPSPTATPLPPPPTATTEALIGAARVARQWDPRLDQLGVRLEEASVAPGQPYWRLIKAEWRNEAEAGGTHHIYVEVLDENSRRLLGQPVTVTWRDGVYPGETENKAPPDFGFNYPMSAAGYSYRVRVEGLPSDQLHNLGLGDIERRAWTIHTSYWLTFQRATR